MDFRLQIGGLRIADFGIWISKFELVGNLTLDIGNSIMFNYSTNQFISESFF